MRARDAMRLLSAALLSWAGIALGADSIFLVSRKDMPDPNFRDTVLLVTRIEGETVGLVLNRPTRLPAAGLFPDLKKNVRPAERVYVGGPVAREFVTFLFKAPAAPEDASEVADGIYLGSNPTLLQAILEGDVNVDALRIFAGYAGWAPGQLEGEVSRGDWHVLRTDASAIFEKNPEKVWPEMDRRVSRTPVRLDAQPRW
jgi:putative transcriptional regulator